MPLFKSRAKRQKAADKAAEKAARQKEREERYRSERDEWKQTARNVREFASRRYLRGQGIEIGGLHRPLHLYEGATVKYLDRLSTEELRRQYPKVADLAQVTVDIVDDGETLGTIAGGSVDFVIANHMVEHTRNPIATVENFLRVVKPGGIVFMAIPDKRFTFDRHREVTPFDHVREDYLRGPEWSDREHYEDWARRRLEMRDEEAIQRYVEESMAGHANIHFHVWTQVEIVEMFLGMRREFGFPLDMEAAILSGDEVVIVLRKSGGEPASGPAKAAEADPPGESPETAPVQGNGKDLSSAGAGNMRIGDMDPQSHAAVTSPPDESQSLGLEYAPGGSHYRAYVGPPQDYDLIAAMTFNLMTTLGLRQGHTLLDIGCGSLRCGRLFIPYLNVGNYIGIEPNQWLVEEAIRREIGADMIRIKQPRLYFTDSAAVLAGTGVTVDLAVAQSIFSHAAPDLTCAWLTGIFPFLSPAGALAATFLTGGKDCDGTGWVYPHCVYYTHEGMAKIAAAAGYSFKILDWWHPRQTWGLFYREKFDCSWFEQKPLSWNARYSC
jgi:SAM-dependent methyltransferase